MATTPTSWTGGGTAGDWTSAGNWSNGVPVANGEVTINATDDAIQTNLPNGSLDYANVVVGPNFKGTIGTSSTSAVFSISNVTDVTTPTLRWASGGGQSYIGVGTSGIDRLRVQHGGPGRLNLTGSGAVPDFQIADFAGDLTISITGTITALRHNGKKQIVIDSGPTITTAVLMGPTLSRSDIVTAYVGKVLQMLGTGKASTKAWVLPGGTYQKHSSGTDAAVEVLPNGTFTPVGSLAGDYTVTTMTQHMGATVVKSSAGVNGTFTNDGNVGVDE